jgi:hypothetical protein
MPKIVDKNIKRDCQFLALKGYELNNINVGCSRSSVYKYTSGMSKVIAVSLGSKTEPYYDNEDDYCKDLSNVGYEDLSKQEKKIWREL